MAEELVYGNGCILVVDDEDVIRETAQTILEKLGYSVLLANDGAEAIEQYTKHDGVIDLVLLDMIMPRMNGRECYEELKRINPEVRIVLCSGYLHEEVLQELLENGLNGFLSKPFRSHELSKTIHEALTA